MKKLMLISIATLGFIGNIQINQDVESLSYQWFPSAVAQQEDDEESGGGVEVITIIGDEIVDNDPINTGGGNNNGGSGSTVRRRQCNYDNDVNRLKERRALARRVAYYRTVCDSAKVFKEIGKVAGVSCDLALGLYTADENFNIDLDHLNQSVVCGGL